MIWGKKKKKYMGSVMYYIKNEMLYLCPLTLGKVRSKSFLMIVEPVIELKLPATAEELNAKLQECFSLSFMNVVKVKEFPIKGLSSVARHVGAKTEKQFVNKYDYMSVDFIVKQKKYRVTYDMKKEKNYYINGKREELDEDTVIDFILKIIQD